MNIIDNVFSTSFLLSVTVIVIMIGGMFAYINFRISEQDYKVKSMMDLVSAYAATSANTFTNLEQLNESMRKCEDNILSLMQGDTKKILLNSQPETIIIGGNNSLIEVSDEEDYSESDSESDSETDNETDNESDNEIDMSTKMPDMILLNEDNIENEINVIKMNNAINDMDDDNQSNHSEGEHNDVFLEESNTIGYESVQFDQLPQENDLHNQNLEELDIDDLIKTDLITNSEFIFAKTNDEIDYKKMSINKLREIVLQKKLVNDASKLKKNDLLKVLETHSF